MTRNDPIENVNVGVSTEELAPVAPVDGEEAPAAETEEAPKAPEAKASKEDKKGKKDAAKKAEKTESKSVKVKFLIGLVYGAKKYKKGEVAELSESELENFIESWYELV